MAVIVITSVEVTLQAQQAWEEVQDVVNALEKPKESNIGYFTPSDHCRTVIDLVSREYSKKASASQQYADKPPRISNCLHAGFVYFGDSTIGRPFTIMIPLKVVGNVTLGDVTVDAKHYYHIMKQTYLKVSENSNIAAVVISEIT
ncbi:hypothetical protein LOZ58_000069 [Ophidiomyces ophidiicola]|nr:hypothetical protein LOZ66_002513 [Ophidiomyces ophidiicola]KAI1966581.1 hypothetical protein LOZ58_000069 [Ophidiomyces ophidiicola]